MRSVRPGKTTTVKRNNTDLQPVLQFVFIAWPYSCRNFTPLVLQLPMLFTFERTDDIEKFVNATHFTSYSWRKVCSLFAPSNDTTKIPSKRLTTPLGFQNDRSRIFFFFVDLFLVTDIAKNVINYQNTCGRRKDDRSQLILVHKAHAILLVPKLRKVEPCKSAAVTVMSLHAIVHIFNVHKRLQKKQCFLTHTENSIYRNRPM